VLEQVEAAEAEQALADVGAHLGLAAGADLEPTEIRVPQRPFDADVAAPLAIGTVGLAQALGLRSRRNRRAGP
jgi:hypothetical protein